jgi:tetratricopeptide (TPR) repeat protein
MTISWVDEFSSEIARIGKERFKQNSVLPKKASLPLEFLETLETFEEGGREEFLRARTILKQGLKGYWEKTDPWQSIAVADGVEAVSRMKSILLKVLTGTRKDNHVYMNFVMRDLLEWMSRHGDSFEALWSERLAFLFFEAHGDGDRQRKSYVTNLFYAVKAVSKIKWDFRRDKSAVHLWQLYLKSLVTRFENVVGGFSDPAQSIKWEPIVVHYKLEVSDDDDELAKLFLASKAAYNKDPSSSENLRQYAWVVHDCIKRAIGLANIKLVETFTTEGKRIQPQFEKIPLRRYWPLEQAGERATDAMKASIARERNGDETVVKAIGTILEKAELFLSGEGEASQWMKKGDLPKAIAAYKEGLERDANNREARIGLIELYLRNADVASASNLLIDGLVTVEFVKRLTKVIRSAFFSWKSCFFKQAEFYLTCVEKLGDDLATLASTNFSVAECLYHCALAKKYLSGEVLVLSHQLVITVFEDLFKRGVKWPKERQTVAGCLGRLLLASGRIDEARPYIKETLVSNPESPIAWTDYGRTFGKESIDAAKCFCRAICCPSAKASLTLTAHELLGEYFETTGQMPRALREYNTCDAIRRRNGWRPHSRSLGIYLTNLMNDTKTPAPVPSNEDVYAKLSASAGEFLSTGTTDVRGVIVSVLKSNVRVWCESPNEEGRGFFTYVARGGITDLVRGTPVWVSLNQFRNTKVVASWSIRTDGVPWDIYPIEVGVVTKVDFNRGFWHIVLGCDVELSVGADRVPSVVGIPVGAFVQVRKVETAGVPEILAVSPVKAPLAMPTFVRRVEGVCVKSKQSRFGRIDDVFVPERLCKDVPSGTQMAVFAVEVEDHRKKKKGWLAFAPAQDDLRRMDVACG